MYRSPIAIETLGLDRNPVPENCGLPLGGYFSHWSGGLYLDGLDHHVKRVLKIPAYLRYMATWRCLAMTAASWSKPARRSVRGCKASANYR